MTSDSTLQNRLDELERSHAFIALHYTLRAAEHLDAWVKTYEELGESVEADGCRLAADHLRNLANEQRKAAGVGVGDLT